MIIRYNEQWTALKGLIQVLLTLHKLQYCQIAILVQTAVLFLCLITFKVVLQKKGVHWLMKLWKIVLLLTGYARKVKMESVSTSQRLQGSSNDSIIVPTTEDSEKREGFDTSLVGLGVAFNSFFPSKKDHAEEQERLEKNINGTN